MHWNQCFTMETLMWTIISVICPFTEKIYLRTKKIKINYLFLNCIKSNFSWMDLLCSMSPFKMIIFILSSDISIMEYFTHCYLIRLLINNFINFKCYQKFQIGLSRKYTFPNKLLSRVRITTSRICGVLWEEGRKN